MLFRVIAFAFCLSFFGFCQSDNNFGGSAGNENQTNAPKALVGEETGTPNPVKSSVDDAPGSEPISKVTDNEQEDGQTREPMPEESTANPVEDDGEKNQRFNIEEMFDKEDEDEVCYRTLGCFRMGDPWKSVLRPISAPMSPEKIAAFIRFFSRKNREQEVNITLYPELDMNGAQFEPNKLTVFMVHGFASFGGAEWLTEMKDAYLKHVDANVMVVDWGKGSQLFNYLQVAGNTRLVGRQLVKFAKKLIEDYGADPKKFHLIGHSLGAHICSYLAKGVRGIPRLTALDPAQPGFEGFDEKVRLADTDADFIDVVHTDAKPVVPTLGFGMIKPVGHVDFYMNGGFSQPGCLIPDLSEVGPITSIADLAKVPVEILAKIPSCPHGRAYQYFTEAINDTEKCTFWGRKTNPVDVLRSATNTVTQGIFKNALSLSDGCTIDNCVPLGFDTASSPLRGVFLVTTAGREPYCLPQSETPEEKNEKKDDSIFDKMGKKLVLPLRF